MAYSIRNTRNTEVASIANNTLQVTTFGIRIPGKNYVGYGEAIGQSLLHILENHAAPNSGSDTPTTTNPAVDLSSPVDGQLWYDLTNKKLRVYDSTDGAWNVASGAAAVQDTAPSSPSEGDMWYNSDTDVKQVLVYDGSVWRQLGPNNYGAARFNNAGHNRPIIVNVGGTGGLASGNGSAPTGGTNYDAMGTFINNTLVEITIDTAITGTYFYVELNDDSGTVQYYSWDGYDNNTALLSGVNILDDDSGYQFNGSARHADTADALSGTTADSFIRNDNGTGAAASRLPSTTSLDIGGTSNRWGTIWADTFDGTATAALYADLAERYETDMFVEPGDVVELGGLKEITKAEGEYNPNVFGVISTNPAFMMNQGAGDDSTHPYVALTGRVPVKVKGAVAKGDRIVCSDVLGVAMAEGNNNNSDRAVIGRSLVAKTTDGVELIEVVVGVK